MGEIEAGTVGGAPGSVDGRNIVMHFRVRVEREPFADEGQPVGEVEGAKARAGVVGAVLDSRAWGGKAKERLQEGVEGDGLVPLATPDHGALEAEFEVFRGPEADLLDMRPGAEGIGVAFERADQKIVAEGAGEPGEQRNVERLDAVDAEGIDVLGVVGVGHAAAQAGPEPVVLFAEGEYVVEVLDGGVGLHYSSIGGCGDGPRRNGGLLVQRDGGSGVEVVGSAVHRGESLSQSLGVAGGRGTAK